MHIMTAQGWKQLCPKDYTPEQHTPTLLEAMGITDKYDGVAAFADYCNSTGVGVYFTYRKDGTFYQSKGAKHPLPGMYGEKD